ncbi:alpha,alpha-trehalose-phosphate synthase (UDP-forming) [Parenemella sanctibonifatiensis]|uniref:Trehalose-6-phosphate synthase n=1 Tax=Parenemella sanctibonifatiensis TaxID=2016505 RepID=A0A255EGZ3_9ACTN|nr:trehalose-6-phosphate synthase [Parenemella sanctibonifatiensis]OYN90814.1 trehalose-6-phosphate synthase [Parenemella sanctibonifatiensis]
MADQKYDFVVVANRLPVDRHRDADGNVTWRTSPGGLVTAMEPVMASHDGAWIGWTGAPDEELEPFDEAHMHLVPVPLSQQEINEYYEGFSNSTLWPLYHDAVEAPEFHREWWDAYVQVNQRFADRAAAVADKHATVWVQDYQLQLVPAMLREQRPDLRIGFFLHIPFPPVELFQQLPWRRQICEGLLGADLVGFQLNGGARNFVRTCRVRLGLKTHRDQINVEDRIVEARAYPISIDAQGFADLAGTEEVAARAIEIREDLGSPETLFVGIDRLDYTKGLRQRFQAFGELFSSGQLDPDSTHFLQVATPSRERVEQYMRLRDDIELLVGRTNGHIGRIGMPPISYLHASYPRTEMAALYRAADIMVVTPLRDGMNLVAKEFIACRDGNNGALVLSEFAGAAAELKQAYMVNPHDINGLKNVILRTMDDDAANRARRMKAMRKQVFEHDINHWADRFLSDLAPEED